tara:strand:- start:208 stop:585 length:378 start_codon:yes stop_codon:yes gene_type:complete
MIFILSLVYKMDTQEFRPFVDSSNSRYIKLPNFDTIITSNIKTTTVNKKEEIKQDKGKKEKKENKKIDLSDINIDFEKLKQTKGKTGYTLSELNEIVDKINKKGIILIKKNNTKPKLAEIILNLQ